MGAVHLKIVVAHTGVAPVAFIGGIDFSWYRIAGEMHTDGRFQSPVDGAGAQQIDPTADARLPRWHDMAVKIEGPAVQTFYDTYRLLWNEQIFRHSRQASLPDARYRRERFRVGPDIVPAVVDGTSLIPAKPGLVPAHNGTQRLQVSRTIPQFNLSERFYQWPLFGGVPPAWSQPLNFAPLGAFEVAVALARAIKNADSYIYIEDNGFGSLEIMDWLNAAVGNNSDLKIIMLMGAPDPADPKEGEAAHVEAVNNHLLSGLTPDQTARIGLFVRRCADVVLGNEPPKREAVIIHAKVVIVDDRWLFVGTANQMNRSLYTDVELSVGILDGNLQSPVAKQARVDLWGGHFGLDPGQRGDLTDLSRALAVWDPAWGTNPPFPLPGLIERRAFPLPPIQDPVTGQDLQYEPRQACLYRDPDSRQTLPDDCYR